MKSLHNDFKQINIAVRPQLADAFRVACAQAQIPMREVLVRLMAAYCADPPPLPKETKAQNYASRAGRRKATAAIIEQLAKIMVAEEEYRHRIPKNFQTSSRFEAAEQAVEALDEAIGILQGAFE